MCTGLGGQNAVPLPVLEFRPEICAVTTKHGINVESLGNRLSFYSCVVLYFTTRGKVWHEYGIVASPVVTKRYGFCRFLRQVGDGSADQPQGKCGLREVNARKPARLR